MTREVIDEHGGDVERRHADDISIPKEFVTARAFGNEKDAKAKEQRQRRIDDMKQRHDLIEHGKIIYKRLVNTSLSSMVFAERQV